MDRIFSDDKIEEKFVAFFDLDRTIIGEISGRAIVRTAWKKGMISYSDLLNAVYLYLLFKLKLRDPLRIIDDMVGWVKGMRETDMAKLCSEVLTDTLLYSVFSEARKEINFHKNNGVKVIILSSTLDYICRSMSENLGMDGFICSSLESKDGLFTGRPVGRLCYGEEKLERLTGYCSTNTIDHSCLWYYADSISDLPVLNAVGHPVCINPDRKLNREALKRGWKTLRWSN